jgi:hypothetical protein
LLSQLTLYDCIRSITSIKTICYLLYCCVPQLLLILIAYNIVLYYSFFLYTHNWLISCIIYKFVCNLFRFTITSWIFLFTIECMNLYSSHVTHCFSLSQFLYPIGYLTLYRLTESIINQSINQTWLGFFCGFSQLL